MSEERKDTILTYAAFITYIVLIFQEIIISLNVMRHEDARVVSIIISAVFMAAAILVISSRSLMKLIISYFLVLLVVFSTFLLHPTNTPYVLDGLFYVLLMNVPTFLCLASIRSLDKLNSTLLTISHIVAVLAVFYFLFVIFGVGEFSLYNMSLSYYVQLPAMVFLKQRKLSYNIMALALAFIMLFMGSRGALVITIGYWLVLNRFFLKREYTKRLIVVVLIFIVIAVNFQTIFLYVENQFGITSRTMNMLLQKGISDSTGRDQLFQTTWENILRKPLFGHGIFADRYVLDGLLGGVYVHNVVLEILHSFGFIFGGGMILVIFFAFIRKYRNSSNQGRDMMMFLFFLGLVPLLVSGSFLTNAWFALFLGSLFMRAESSEDFYVDEFDDESEDVDKIEENSRSQFSESGF